MSCNCCQRSLFGSVSGLLARNGDAHVLTDKRCEDAVLAAGDDRSTNALGGGFVRVFVFERK